MEKREMGRVILDKQASGDLAVADSPSQSKEIWISPTHWNAMGDEKQAIVVDLWHRNRSYSREFPFKSMEKSQENKYDVGVTFTVGSDESLENQAMLETLKALKIPHLASTWDDVSSKKEKFVKKG